MLGISRSILATAPELTIPHRAGSQSIQFSVRCSASEIMSAAIRFTADAMRPPRCSVGESLESGKLFCCPCLGSLGSLFSPMSLCCLVMRSHPPVAHMSHLIQGHRLAFPQRAFLHKRKLHDEHKYPIDAFAALDGFKLVSYRHICTRVFKFKRRPMPEVKC